MVQHSIEVEVIWYPEADRHLSLLSVSSDEKEDDGDGGSEGIEEVSVGH